MACAICKTRRPRRYCPGVQGEICTLCCGTERENTVDCPLDCVYLQEAHQHERLEPVSEKELPDRDIEITENFMESRQELLAWLMQSLAMSAREVAGLADHDVREALEALVRTYRTLESGVYYETRPANILAARVCDLIRQRIPEFEKMEREKLGVTRTRDADILRMLVFLERLAADRYNGRPRCRAFLSFMWSEFGATLPGAAPSSSPLIIT
jgi:hypothetical protein